MDSRAEIAAELGERIRAALTQKGHNQTWLARKINRSQGAISKLLTGSWIEHGGVGRRLVSEVEMALGFADGALVNLFNEANGLRSGEQDLSPARVDVRPARELLTGSLLADAWLRPLRCYLVAPDDSRDDGTVEALRNALQHSAVEVVRCALSWGTFEGVEAEKVRAFGAACEEAETCDFAVLVISRTHAETCGQWRSTLEAFAEHFAATNLPCLVATSPGAADFTYRLKHREGVERNVVERLYRFEPVRGKPLTYFRINEAASTGALVRDVLTAVSTLAAASLFNLRAMSRVICNDDVLADIESAARETWVYTPDFYYELEDSRWRQIVVASLRRGSRYRWLFPRREGNRARHLYERIAVVEPEAAARNLAFFGLGDDELPWWPQVVVYDPHDDDTRQAFMYELWDRTMPLSCNHNYRLMPRNAGRLMRAFEEICTDDRWFPVDEPPPG